MRAAKEVEAVLGTIRETEVLRAVAADEAAAELGLGSNPSLRALAEACEEPWRSILRDHRDAFEAATLEITALADANRDLITTGYRSARETLLSVGQGVDGYGQDGAAVSDPRATGWWTGACDVSGTFASFNTALSALRYQRVALDVAAGNVANVSSEGYARRRVAAESVGAPAAPAMWSRYTAEGGEGVRVVGVERLATTASTRARASSTRTSPTSTSAVGARALRGRRGGARAAPASTPRSTTCGRRWHDLANNPGGDAARSQVLAAAGTLVDALRVQARNVAAEARASASSWARSWPR